MNRDWSNDNMKDFNIKFSKAIFMTAIYFGIMLLYTFADVVLWRKILPQFSNWLNIITIVICVCLFISFLKKQGYKVEILSNVSLPGIFLAIGCSVLFYIILDNLLDPIFEGLFPASEAAYQEAVQGLIKSPVTSLLQVCIIAPVIEEILMRGFILGGLKNNYGTVPALLVSSMLFALLHFNMVQTLSAFICGIILGLLYIKTKAILCCIIAHCGYNLISYIVMVYPFIGERY